MTRWKASAIHLAISLTIAAFIGSLIYFVWYPRPYFQAAGGNTLMLLIMSVDIVLGPLLTLVVFKPGKKSLRFDLAVIALLQLAAFCYGISVIAAARPVFVVAAVDRFVVVSANQLDDADLARGSAAEFRTRSWLGPRLVGAQRPTNPKEKNDLLFSGLAGKDIELFPKTYVPYAQVAEAMAEKARSLEDLQAKSPAAAEQIRQSVAAYGGTLNDYYYLPLRGRIDWFAMILSKTTQRPVTALPIDPW
jgi:hypothetical protein